MDDTKACQGQGWRDEADQHIGRRSDTGALTSIASGARTSASPPASSSTDASMASRDNCAYMRSSSANPKSPLIASAATSGARWIIGLCRGRRRRKRSSASRRRSIRGCRGLNPQARRRETCWRALRRSRRGTQRSHQRRDAERRSHAERGQRASGAKRFPRILGDRFPVAHSMALRRPPARVVVPRCRVCNQEYPVIAVT
jgi:hypothetical protein